MADDEEKRREHRQRTLKGGRIVFNGGFGVAECTVRNLSGSGALLDLPNPMIVPAEFLLYVSPDPHGRPSRVIWRAGNRIGVVFTGPPQEAPSRKHVPPRRRDEGY